MTYFKASCYPSILPEETEESHRQMVIQLRFKQILHKYKSTSLSLHQLVEYNNYTNTEFRRMHLSAIGMKAVSLQQFMR
jgi:hypothetical protein